MRKNRVTQCAIADDETSDVLDGAMIVLAMYTLNVFHPARLLNQHDARQPEIPMAMKYSTSSM